MYELFYKPGACSMAVHVVLRELGQEPKLIDVTAPDFASRSPEFAKINPRGRVPVLVDAGTPIREGGAILSYILDKHNSPMLPKTGTERAAALEWLMWCNATLHPSFSRAFWITKNVADEKQRQALLVSATRDIQELFDEAEARLAKTPFLAGKDVTAADILFTVITNWTGMLATGSTIRLGDNVRRVIKAVIARPSYQKALTVESVEYKAVAA